MKKKLMILFPLLFLVGCAQTKVASEPVDELVLTYEEVSYCNLAMKKANRDKIKQIFSNEYNKDIDFIAIPFATWKEVSDEFIKLYRANRQAQRRDFIKLSPVYVDGLRINSDDVEVKEEEESDEFKDFVDSFKDIIEVK